MNASTRLRKFPFWSWVWFILGVLYFVLPLFAMLDFSLRMERDVIGFKAYQWPLPTKNFCKPLDIPFSWQR